jgi:UDP-2,3-diacylglucosamine pyrophosphatase LpxH
MQGGKDSSEVIGDRDPNFQIKRRPLFNRPWERSMAGMMQVHLRRWCCVVCLAVVLPVALGYAAEPQGDSLYFIQITDTHFGAVRHYHIAEKLVNQINRLPFPIRCVVHTGDIMADNIEDNSAVERGRRIMDKLAVPIYYLPGNHDIELQNPDATHKAYLKSYGPLVTRIEYQNVIFLLIYTEPLRTHITIGDYQPLVHLEAHLKKSLGKPVVVFHHAPSIGSFYKNKLHRGWRKDIRQEWVRLLNAYGVKAVIAGHFHRDEHHWLGEVPLYICSPMAPYWSRQPTFRIYEYRDGKIGYRTQYLE